MNQLEERMDRIFSAHPFGVWVVTSTDAARQLSRIRAGQILVVSDQDEVRFIPASECEALGCVAGWISEDETP